MTAAVVASPAVALTAGSEHAAQTWAALAPRIAARPTMRLWAPGEGEGFADRTALTKRLPDAPAAVPVYSRRRTRLLVFDLDSKRAGADTVAADRARLAWWLTGYGARFISDRSTSAGAHVIVPLARAVTVEQLGPFLRAAAALYPSLDITPMLNPKQGAISVPGSACREGGHRLLDGDLDAAVSVLTERNHPDLFNDLVDSIVTPERLDTPTPQTAEPAHLGPQPPADCFGGSGADARLLPFYRRTSPMPAPARAFAEAGTMPAAKPQTASKEKATRREGRAGWSPSEARQSVLTHACWRGLSLREVRSAITTGSWADGLGVAYQRYEPHQRDTALCRDWAEAQRWVAGAVRKVQTAQHRKVEHTGGSATLTRTALQRRWLAHAIAWCDVTFRSDCGRWLRAAVLQGLGSAAAKTQDLVNGVPVVGVGGRSLSIGAGLVSEAAVWSTLRTLRDMPGSPLLLVQTGTGTRADRYALVTPDVTDPYPDAPGRPHLVDVHPVWSAIGLRYRRLYEVVAEAPEGLHTDDLATAARMSRSSTYDGINELVRVGLVARRRAHISLTDLTLDDLGEQLGVFEERAARIAQHQAARAVWRDWLAGRRSPVLPPPTPPHSLEPQIIWTTLSANDEEDYHLAVVMSAGP